MGMRSESQQGKPLVSMAIRFTYHGIPYSVLTHAYATEVDVFEGTDTDLAMYILTSSERMNLESADLTITEIVVSTPHAAI